jgi:hypothetical protein
MIVQFHALSQALLANPGCHREEDQLE